MRAWWLLAFARFAGAAPDLLFHAPDGRVPTFAPRPPVPNPVDDPDWLVAASGFCSDFSFAPDGSIDFKFHPEVSVAFTDAPFHQAASLEDGIEIRGEEYSQTDVLAAGTWTNKNIALLEPTSSCDDPPAGSQDEWAVSVFKVTGNEACGEECVHFSGLVSGASDNFVARKEGRFLCKLFVESHTFPDQARRSLRRRLTPRRLLTARSLQPAARSTVFAATPLPLTPTKPAASWLIAAAGICSELTVTPNAGTSADDQSGRFVADIAFKFRPDTSVAFTKSPDHRATEIVDGFNIQGKEFNQTDVLASAVWDLKNIALLEPTSSCDDPPAGSQDEWAISVFIVTGNEACGEECVRYTGRVSAETADLEGRQRAAQFPCMLYVDSSDDGVDSVPSLDEDGLPDFSFMMTDGCPFIGSDAEWIKEGTTASGAPYYVKRGSTDRYFYWEPDCSGGQFDHGGGYTYPIWMIWNTRPSTTAKSNLAGGGGHAGCPYCCYSYADIYAPEWKNFPLGTYDGDYWDLGCGGNGDYGGNQILTIALPPSPPPKPPPLPPPPPSPPASCGQLDCDLPPGLCSWTASEAPLITILTYDGPTKFGPEPAKDPVDQKCPQYYRDVKDAAECEALAKSGSYKPPALLIGCDAFGGGTQACVASSDSVTYHLAPAGADECDIGEKVASSSECGTAVAQLAASVDTTPGRSVQVGSGGTCGDGSWGWVPIGCSAQTGTGGDWAAHFKTEPGSNCGTDLYSLVCKQTPGLNWAGTLTNDQHWISGCFEWYGSDTPPPGVDPYFDFHPQGFSKNIYWNDKDSNPNQGEIGGHKVCTRDESATVTSGLTYWDPSDSSERMQRWGEWNAKCGDSFWATSFDWGAIAAPSAVTVCTGSMCAASSIKEACDYDTCSDPSAGCNFDFNMYATILVYSSQLRVATVVEGLPAGASREQLSEAREQLSDLIDSLNAYQSALDNLNEQVPPEYSAAGLIGTQIATVSWASNALSVASGGIMMGNFSGFVPAFNLNFYQEKLESYFTEFQELLFCMQRMEKIQDINNFLVTKNAINAAVDKSTTQVSMEQTIATVESAASGMSAALVAMRRLNETIYQAGVDFQESLDEYYAQKKREAIWNLAFAVANLATASRVPIGAFDENWKKKSGGDFASQAIWAGEQFANSAKTTAEAANALGQANEDVNADKKFPSTTAVTLTNELLTDLEDSDVPVPGDIPDSEEMATLQAALDSLNKELPLMGWGFWTEYYANMKESYNEYLTGYSTSINAAAQHIIDLIDAQKDYGNDYVNQGMRYVGGLQQYLIDAQTLDIYTQANDALAAAYDDLVPDGYLPLQQSTQAVQITSLGLQMQAVVVQLCQSYAYQTTGLFQRCVAGSTATENSLHNLCYNTAVGVLPSLAPLEFDVCGSTVEFMKAANEYVAPFNEMNDWAREVNCYVNKNLWGGKDDKIEAIDYPFVALKLEVYNATCDRSSPKVTVEMGSCIIADCPSSDDAAVKCFDRSSMTCTDYLAGVEWDLADDETCCESRRETFNCTEPPGEPPTYSMDGKLRKDGYTKPYIRLEDFERFVDPDSEDWGKLVISWDIAYIREATGLTDDKEGVFVRGIAAYLEGATVGDNIEDPDEIIVTLTATGEMTNQVKIPDRCSAASCRFDNYPFSGAPSGQAYCYTDDDGNPVCNEYNTLKYQARYQNTKGGPGAGCQYYGNPKPVFTTDKAARDRPDDCGKLDACLNESLDCPCYCTSEDYEGTYQNENFMGCDQSGTCDLSGPYNSAGLFSSYNLAVTGTAYEDDDGIDGQRRYNINLHGVKAIHLGLWLKTTSAAGSGQCGDIASPGGQCAPPPPPTEATCTAL